MREESVSTLSAKVDLIEAVTMSTEEQGKTRSGSRCLKPARALDHIQPPAPLVLDNLREYVKFEPTPTIYPDEVNAVEEQEYEGYLNALVCIKEAAYAQAQKFFERRLLQESPTNSTAWLVSYCESLLGLGRVNADKKMAEKAKHLLESRLNRGGLSDHEEKWVYLTLGNILILLATFDHQYGDALLHLSITYFRDAANRVEFGPRAISGLSVACKRLKQVDVFAELTEMVYKMDPRDGMVRNNYACSKIAQREFDEAKSLLTPLKRHGSLNLFAFYNLACIYSINKETDKAMAYLRHLLNKGCDRSLWYHAETDADFKHLRNGAQAREFRKMLEEGQRPCPAKRKRLSTLKKLRCGIYKEEIVPGTEFFFEMRLADAKGGKVFWEVLSEYGDKKRGKKPCSRALLEESRGMPREGETFVVARGYTFGGKRECGYAKDVFYRPLTKEYVEQIDGILGRVPRIDGLDMLSFLWPNEECTSFESIMKYRSIQRKMAYDRQDIPDYYAEDGGLKDANNAI